MLQFVFSYFLSPLISIFDQLISPLPWIKYVILSVMSIIFLPFWSLLAIWGLIIYLADFVIRFHILFYVSIFHYLFSFSLILILKGLGCFFTRCFKFQILELYFKNDSNFHFLCVEQRSFVLFQN